MLERGKKYIIIQVNAESRNSVLLKDDSSPTTSHSGETDIHHLTLSLDEPREPSSLLCLSERSRAV